MVDERIIFEMCAHDNHNVMESGVKRDPRSDKKTIEMVGAVTLEAIREAAKPSFGTETQLKYLQQKRWRPFVIW